jgi:amino acid permease
MSPLHRRRKLNIVDNMIAGLVVSLIITLVNILNSFLPKELGQNFIYLIDGVIIVIVLYIVLQRSHRIQ